MTAAAAEDRDRVGPYRVIKAIGAGGSARIDLARIDRAYGFQRHVVLKRPLEHLRGDAQVAASLRREARIGGRLRHPNLVAILDAGVHDGYDYLVLEYVHGAALRAVMQGDTPGQVRDLPLGVALAIVGDAARGMHEAHELTDDAGSPLGLVHRDVSPGNILLGLDGTVKLADFGIAKETRVSTLSGSMHGTVTYMAPEQCQGHAFDRRADVFSLGVVLYELVTGARLFWADNDVASLHRVLSGAVPRPRSIRPQIAPALEDILMTAVAHDPARRFATALDLAAAIERHAAGAGEVLGARWIARSVEAVVGPRPVPWIAAAPADGDADAVRDAGAPRHAGPEATPPGGSLVALIAAAGADGPEPAFGDGSPDDSDADDARPGDASAGAATEADRSDRAALAAPPRRRRARIAASISAAAITAIAITTVWLTGRSGTLAGHAATDSAATSAPTSAPPSASIAAPSGSAASPAGSPRAPSRSIAAPSGSTGGPSESTTTSSGSPRAPAGSTAAPSGSTAAPNGTIAPPGGSAAIPQTQQPAPGGSHVDRHPPAAATTSRMPGERPTPGKRRRSSSKPAASPATGAALAPESPAPAPSPAPAATAATGSAPASPAAPAPPPAQPPAKIEWKPTLLLPTDGSKGTPRR